ncbi:MAG: M48 family peptidase [Flavobacteriales bacterium]|nr:MAG: M48 family peptidase [Flavobacteriales bacterium]
MKKLMILGIASSLIVISSCSTVPLTGRSRLSLVDDSQLQQQAAIGYQQLLSDPSTKVVSTNSTQTQMVKRVGSKIAAAVTQYMNQNGYGEQIKNYKWEFNLIESKEINAWCMPGGKVAIYTGILPTTKDEAGLATVMGHEIAHAIAQHSAERASQMTLAQAGSAAVGVATSNSKYADYINQAYGIGGQLVILKYGRNQELEADKMGLSFMAMAGYNPSTAVGFWQRMAQASAGSAKPPAFLSTHPTDQSRIAQIQRDLPEAMKYYKK